MTSSNTNRGESPPRVTASRAKREFHLSEAELKTLDCISKRNPCYRSAAPMRLYSLADIQTAQAAKAAANPKLAAKWAAAENQRLEKERKEQARDVRRKALKDILEGIEFWSDTACCAYIESGVGDLESIARDVRAKHEVRVARQRIRRIELTDALHAVGCELRSDSTICANYIRSGAGNPDAIAQTMLEMKFFYNFTRYSAIQRNMWAYERDMFYDGDDSDDDDEEDIAEIIRQSSKDKALYSWVVEKGPMKTLEDMSIVPSTLVRRVQECAIKLHLREWALKNSANAAIQYLTSADIVNQVIESTSGQVERVRSYDIAHLYKGLPKHVLDNVAREKEINAIRATIRSGIAAAGSHDGRVAEEIEKAILLRKRDPLFLIWIVARQTYKTIVDMERIEARKHAVVPGRFPQNCICGKSCKNLKAFNLHVQKARQNHMVGKECYNQACIEMESAAKRIQSAWRRASCDPAFAICSNRLRREFYELETTCFT